MIEHETLLVTLVSRIPLPPPPATRGRGRPRADPDRRLRQALVVRRGRHRHTVQALVRVLAPPPAERHTVRGRRTGAGRLPARRPGERWLQAMPAPRPGPLGGRGRALVSLLPPWARCGRAAARDRTRGRARGGVWPKQARAAGTGLHPARAPDAPWTKSGWHGGG